MYFRRTCHTFEALDEFVAHCLKVRLSCQMEDIDCLRRSHRPRQDSEMTDADARLGRGICIFQGSNRRGEWRCGSITMVRTGELSPRATLRSPEDFSSSCRIMNQRRPARERATALRAAHGGRGPYRPRVSFWSRRGQILDGGKPSCPRTPP